MIAHQMEVDSRFLRSLNFSAPFFSAASSWVPPSASSPAASDPTNGPWPFPRRADGARWSSRSCAFPSKTRDSGSLREQAPSGPPWLSGKPRSPPCPAGKDRFRSRETSCALVYTLPTSIVNETLATETMPSEDRTLRLSAAPQAGQMEAWSGVGPSKTRSWVIFPPSPCPFLVTRLSNRTLSVRSSAVSWIPHNGTLHYLRAVRALVLRYPGQEPAFCTEDMTTGSGLQERVAGILAFRAEFDPGSRLVTLRVLSRGGRRHAEAVSPRNLADWPETIPEEDRHYVLALTRWLCRIRNGGDSL